MANVETFKKNRRLIWINKTKRMALTIKIKIFLTQNTVPLQGETVILLI